MTLTAAPAPVEVRAPAWASGLQRAVPTVATGAVLVWWATGLVRGSGGRDSNALTVGLFLLAAALVIVRPWRHLPFTALAIPGVLAAAALAVLPVGGVGREGAVAAGAYVLAGALVVLLGAWTSSEDRALVLTATVCFAGLAEFCWAFPAWWGGGLEAPGPMVGTFYWWNPYAVYLLAPALLGLLLAVGGDRRWRAVGWLTTPFAVSGIVFSSSRASIACLAVGWLIVCAGLLRQAERRLLALVRAGAVTVLSLVVMFLLTGPLVFRGSVSPFGAASARQGSGQSVSANGGYRLDFWHQAVDAFLRHPVSGAGYGRILNGPHGPAGAYSPLAHNGLLQALGEGGLLLAVPTCVALLAVAVLLLLALRRPRVWSGVPFVAAVAGLGLIAHSLVDTDWTYAADAGALAVCVALAIAPRWHGPHDADRPRDARRAVAGVVLVALVVASAALAEGQHFQILHADPQPGAMS